MFELGRRTSMASSAAPDIGVRFHVVEHCRRDQRSNASRGGSAFILAGDQRTLQIQDHLADEILHALGVHLHTRVYGEHLETVQVPGNVDQLLAEVGVRRKPDAFLPEPNGKRLD